MSNKLYGDWDKLEKVLKQLKENSRQYQEVAKAIGEKIAEKVKEYILGQELSLVPLVEEYRQRKIREGYDPRILIRTGDFVNSIEVTRVEVHGENINVFIGVKGGTTETGLDMTELAEFIEYGTSKQPARQPFALSWEMMKDEISKEIADRVSYIIKGDLK